MSLDHPPRSTLKTRAQLKRDHDDYWLTEAEKELPPRSTLKTRAQLKRDLDDYWLTEAEKELREAEKKFENKTVSAQFVAKKRKAYERELAYSGDKLHPAERIKQTTRAGLAHLRGALRAARGLPSELPSSAAARTADRLPAGETDAEAKHQVVLSPVEPFENGGYKKRRKSSKRKSSKRKSSKRKPTKKRRKNTRRHKRR